MSTVDMDRPILEGNDAAAADLRARFEAQGTLAINLVSSPGTGKTELLTVVMRRMIERGLDVAALVGDCATDNDAARLAASGARVKQIVTEGLCHLESQMIDDHLAGFDGADGDYLFIENVGNLVCPSTFDLGESLRVVALSVTEGEDKPLKYPQIFHSADLALITKMDLAGPCEFDRDTCLTNIESVHPGLVVIETSARQSESVDAFIDALVVGRRQLLTNQRKA